VRTGTAGFVDPHTIESDAGPRLRAHKIILCTGGVSRTLPVPGYELTATHSDAWSLSSAPSSMLVIGAGATGVQVASIFNAFGSRVTLFEAAPRILASEDDDVAVAVRTALEALGLQILERAGTIDGFERCPAGVRLIYSSAGARRSIDAMVAVVAVGWVANTAGLRLEASGVQTDERGSVKVDAQLRTTAPHVLAAGDVTGKVMVIHEAIRQARLAATNAVRGTTTALLPEVSPLGSFTDPEYASVGLTEAAARQDHEVVVATERFSSQPRALIDGRPLGFCKLIVDRTRHTILGCHIVGERAVELSQLAAIAIAGGIEVDRLALVPFSFPTYANALGRAAIRTAEQLELGTELPRAANHLRVAHPPVANPQSRGRAMPLSHCPLQPARDDVAPEEREAYDRVVARQKGYGYDEFMKRFPPEHRQALETAAGLAGGVALECDPQDQVQPYMGAMLNSPLIMNLISELGVVFRTRGEQGNSYEHKDREWVDMVLAEELQCWGVYYGHMADAVAVGVRPEAIQALREGRDEDLSRDELQLARHIRQVARGTVTPDSYRAIEERFGRRGAVEFTAFVGFLIMTIRLMQAFGAGEPFPERFVNELAAMLVRGEIELPDSKARVPQLELAEG
jgi:pyruvate/2-oxoglutarate dehydrogenase complex dihydrolipoamide dehydrogenase (E3) component